MSKLLMDKLPALSMLKLPSVHVRLSHPVKLSILGASLGIGLIVALATYFRRRRRKPPYRDVKSRMARESTDSGGRRGRRVKSPLTLKDLKSPNGDVPGFHVLARRSQSPGIRRQLIHSNSSTSVNTADTLSTITCNNSTDMACLTSEQLCDLGLEALQTAISHWQEAMLRLEDEDEDVNAEKEYRQQQLTLLLERAYRIQEVFEERLFRQVSTNVAVDSVVEAIAEMDKTYEHERRRLTGSIGESSSDQDSFVSASEVPDLSDLEDMTEKYHHSKLILYEAAILELNHGSIPCRTLRTRMVNCVSDTDFLSKLHCIRLALTEMFKDVSIRDWFSESSKKMISDLLVRAERDPEDFQFAFDDMIEFVQNEDNWADMDEELRGRGVKVMNFYDVVIDFILFDAFDDLENPPSSVTTVVQNRWLSNGFKETALSTAVWSVLKAKKRMLRFPKGFIAHFYAISEHTSPVLAWGFLGPEGELRDLCNFFKDQVLGFMRDLFSLDKVRFTGIEELADDIHRLAVERFSVASAKLCLPES